jgi:hypothetical protein
MGELFPSGCRSKATGDVYIDRVPDSDIVKLRCVIRLHPPLLSKRTETVYNGSIEILQTNRNHPLVLAGP